jgi:predicted permease
MEGYVEMSFGWREIRIAARRLAGRPGFALVAIATLALGIGATTALWSAVDTVLLQPLPYLHPERLVRLFSSVDGSTDDRSSASMPDYEDWAAESRSFTCLAGFSRWTFNLAASGPPLRALGASVTGTFFTVLGVSPILGRTFRPEEDQPNGPRVAVLSYGLWQRDFGGARDVLGRKLSVDAVDYTVIGVMPPGFDVPSDVRFWKTLSFGHDRPRAARMLRTIGRLAPGATLASAQGEMNGIAHHLEALYPDTNTDRVVRLLPFLDFLMGKARRALLTLFGAAVFVLLIACGNLANLLLARAAERRSELALRRALGAGRGHLFGEMLVESLLLALPGGLAGVLLAHLFVRSMVALSLAQENSSFLGDRLHDIPRLEQVTIDLRALGFALLASLVVAVLVSLLPAFQLFSGSERRGLGQLLVAGGKGALGRGRGLAVRRAFIVAEVALALGLVVGAGLLLRSYDTLGRRSPGFRTDRRLSFQVSLPARKYSKPAQVAAFYRELERRIGTVPGVSSVGLTWGLPLSGIFGKTTFDVEGRPADPHVQNEALIQPVSARYFSTLGIPLLRGRLFDGRDSEGAARTTIVNAAFARRYFPGQNPLGQQLAYGTSFGPAGSLAWETREIVGVVGDTRSSGLGAAAAPELYFPFTQGVWQMMSVVVRTTADPKRLGPLLRQEVWALDPNLGLSDLETLDRLVARSVAQPRFNSVLLSVFAALALVLAAIGIYGIISYSVSLRVHEIGVRMALGASPREVARQVLSEGTRLTLVGLAIGLLLALGATRVLSSLLFGVSPTDPLSFGLAALLFLAVAVLASYLPARRATRVDPLTALRSS